MNKLAILIVVIAMVGIIVGLFYARRPVPGPSEPLVQLPEPAPIVEEPEFPIPEPEPAPVVEPETPAEPLPTLDESDPLAGQRLGELFGVTVAEALFRPEDLVRRVVVTVDNLPRSKIAMEKRPFRPAAGAFLVLGDEQLATIDPANFRRYQFAVDALVNLDAEQAADLYFQLYPLFQEAYESLGYPEGHFNDRVVEVIDHLLAVPEVTDAVELTRPKVFYEYKEDALQSASAGHKLLLRLGSQNRQRVLDKLAEVRAAVTAGAVKPS